MMDGTAPTKPDSEPGNSIEMLTEQMGKQHSIYGEEIAQLQAIRQNLVEQINYTDERIHRFETARERVKRSMQAITGQDETQAGTKDFGRTTGLGQIMTPHEQYEKSTGIDTLGMPGRNR